MPHSIEYGCQLNANVEGGLTNADLDRQKAAGARWTRINIDMAFVWPTEASYTADTPDWTVGASKARMDYAKSIGLKVLGMVAYVPAWLQIPGGVYPSSPPNVMGTWTTMCARAYRDLFASVDAFEIWNEANLVQFWNDPTSEVNNYRELLRATVNAMRFQAAVMAGIHSWASPKIISSGFASTGSGTANWVSRWDYGKDPAVQNTRNISIGAALDRLFDATLGIVAGKAVNTIYVDGYGCHTYVWGVGTAYPPLHDLYENPLKHCFTRTVPAGTSNYAFWDDIIASREGYTPSAPPNDFKRIWATENGWPATAGVYELKGTEAQVASFMDTEWTFWESYHLQGAGPMFHFQSRDDPNTAGDEVSKYGGLLHLNNSQKPVRAVYKTHADNYAPPALPGGVGTWDSGTTKWDDPLVTWDGGLIGTNPVVPAVVTKVVVKIEIGIPPTAQSTTTALVIGDTNRGKIGTGTVGPDVVWTDISGDFQQLQTHRGKNTFLDRTDVGTVTLEGRNDLVAKGTARDYDPDNWSSPYFPYLLDRPKVRVTLDGVKVFAGVIEDLQPVDDNAGRTSTVTIQGSDRLVLLNHKITFRPGLVQTAKDRIRLIVDLAGSRDVQFLVAGGERFQTGTTQSGNALDMVSDVATVERGMVFYNADEVLIFLDHAYLLAQQPVLTFGDQPSDVVRYSRLERQVGTEQLINRAVITQIHDGAVPQGAADHGSISRRGPLSYEATLPMQNRAEAMTLASDIVREFAVPKSRFKTVTVPTFKYPLAVRQSIFGLELGSCVTVNRTPLGPGTPGVVSQVCAIIGIDHRGDPNTLESTFTLQPRTI